MALLTWAGADGQGCATARAAARARVAAGWATMVPARADVEGLVLARSSESSTGFVGVYASGGGFGAELLKGTKRLRQDGYPSPVEAALERARWTKSLKRGKGHAPSATALASSGCSGQFVPVSGFERPQQPLWNPTEFEGVCTSGAGFDAGLQTGAKHLRQTGASGPFRVALAGATEEDLGEVSPSTTSTSSWAVSPRTTTTSWDDTQQGLQAWYKQPQVASEVMVAPLVFDQEIGSSTFGTIFTLEEQFVAHVTRNYTPRGPGELPMKQWLSCAQLLQKLEQPHASARDLTAQWQPDYVKQLITNQFNDHPTFAGLSFTAWCKLLKEHDVPGRGGGRKSVMKFSFEYTPNWRFSHEW